MDSYSVSFVTVDFFFLFFKFFFSFNSHSHLDIIVKMTVIFQAKLAKLLANTRISILKSKIINITEILTRVRTL